MYTTKEVLERAAGFSVGAGPLLRGVQLCLQVGLELELLTDTADPQIHLIHIDLVIFDAPTLSLDDQIGFFKALDQHSSTLRHLACGPGDRTTFTLEETTLLSDFCRERNVRLSSRGEHTPHIESHYYGDRSDPRGKETTGLCHSVEQVLRFGLDRATACRRTGDLEGVKSLLQHTEGLKALQQGWRD